MIKRGLIESDSAYLVEYYSNHQTTTGTARYVFAVAHVENRYLEAVAAGTWVVVYLERLVVETVLDLNLVVQVDFFVRHGVS